MQRGCLYEIFRFDLIFFFLSQTGHVIFSSWDYSSAGGSPISLWSANHGTELLAKIEKDTGNDGPGRRRMAFAERLGQMHAPAKWAYRVYISVRLDTKRHQGFPDTAGG